MMISGGPDARACVYNLCVRTNGCRVMYERGGKRKSLEHFIFHEIRTRVVTSKYILLCYVFISYYTHIIYCLREFDRICRACTLSRVYII